MKTNVSIKFNSIEEYREIEKKLEELGYVNDKEWNDKRLKRPKAMFVYIGFNTKFNIYGIYNELHYNSLEDFLKD